MKVLVFFSLIVCGQNFQSVEGLPTKFSKSLPNFNTGGTVLQDPDRSIEIPKITHKQAEVILDDLGYETSENPTNGFQIGTRSGFEGSERIRSFQRDNGLPETGILDDETQLAIGSPRCGVRTRKLPRGTPQGHDPSADQAIIPRVEQGDQFGFFGGSGDSADIEISFGGKEHKLRSVRCAFDNPKTLAHAFLPTLGDLHFNTKYFFEGERSLGDFLDTALHEIGHSLGLDHINSEASLMHPTASNQFTKPQPIDIEHIQALYGVRNGSGTYRSAPKFCSLREIDAVFEDVFGKIYAFAGDYFYDLSDEDPEGQLISSKWPGLPGGIDAAFQFGNGRSYFFKGDKYYRFKGSRMERAPLRTIAKGFPGFPSNVDAVMVDGDGDIYAFKGSEYWLYSADLKRAIGPRDIENMGIVPEYVDAVVLRNYQRTNGLPETGILDDETRFVIGQPGCGVRRSDRTASGELQKWHKSTLTYAIANYHVGHPYSTIRALIQQAFHEWSRVTNLDFVEVGDTDSADIELKFGGKHHQMWNGQCSFEGGNTLAHAYDPQFGDVHFNTQYYFDEGNSLNDFLETAVHEIGHSLGLGHILSSASIMHPIATKVFTKPQPIDVQLVQALYGVRNSYSSSSPHTFCSLTKIDAVFKDDSGKTYVFAGTTSTIFTPAAILKVS
ncbi:matrix metalloproteinase-26 [Culex quinquefasciatus]|uniref:Matrix metalloproteinase-14 n=1 Tax=Culex quinquefasciatus TaxID=7176 RepID=B0XCG0_CULQU|nr:matrix metalloproteinase-26 [Culex quinquefasciatus]|eukprot:XP_001867332.1 matrix metalloproteinase-26 [Culex quinquefasciatus]